MKLGRKLEQKPRPELSFGTSTIPKVFKVHFHIKDLEM
jgi:hypothetical protein